MVVGQQSIRNKHQRQQKIEYNHGGVSKGKGGDKLIGRNHKGVRTCRANFCPNYIEEQKKRLRRQKGTLPLQV